MSTPAVAQQESGDSVRAQRDYRSGVELLGDEQYNLARRQFEDFLETHSESALRGRAALGLAESHYGLEQYEQAATNFLRALEEGNLSDAQFDLALGQGAETALRSGRIGLAGDFLSFADQKDPSVYEESTLGLLVRLLREDDRNEEALRYVDVLIEHYPSDEAYYRKADLLARTGEYMAAVDALDNIENFDELPEARFLRAESRLQRGDLAEAQSDYERLIEQEEMVHDARYGLAWVHIHWEDWDRAVELLSQVADEGPDDLAYEATVDRARVVRRRDNVDTAVEAYERAFDRAPEEDRGDLALEIGDYLVAVDRLEQAVPFYEAVQDRTPEARRNLVRAYLMNNHYARARDELETLRDEDGLPGPEWELLLARSYLQLGDIRQAEQQLPEPDELPENFQLEARLIQGRIHFEMERWDRAEEFFQEWEQDVSADEGRYYLGVIAEARGNREEAIERWSDLFEEAEDPWVSRAAVQLLRLGGDLPDVDRSYLHDRVSEEHLTPALELEFSLVRLRENLSEDRSVETARIRELIDRGRAMDRLSDVYGEMLSLPSDHEAWSGFLPDLLDEQEQLRAEHGDRTVRGLIEAGETERARDLVVRHLEQPVTQPEQTRLLVGYADILRRENRITELEPYLPAADRLGNWTGTEARQLGYLITQVHRRLENLADARTMLSTLVDNNQDHPRAHAQLLEWLAGVEIDLGEFAQAEQHLSQVPDQHRSNYGRLNRALAEYHQGEVQPAFDRLTQLIESWPEGPLRMYEYYLRAARHAGTHEEVRDGVDQMLTHYDLEQPAVQQIVIDTSRFWMTEGEQEEALYLLDTVREVAEAEETRIAVDFFRATALFNREDYGEAEEIWTRLNERDLDSPWRERVLRQLVEVGMQTDRWGSVFRYWERLDELGHGGEIGRRILSHEALEEEPENVEDLLVRMEEEYIEHLEPGEAMYWRARLARQEGNPEEAREGFEQYLEEGHEVYREDTIRNLASIYNELGEREEAREAWTRLWEETGELDDLLESVRLQRDLGEVRQAYDRLRSHRDQFEGSRRMRIEFELGLLARERGQWSRAEGHFETVRTGEDTARERRRAAGFHQVEALMNQDQLSEAEALIEELPDDPNRWLIEAELNRRQGNLERARELIERVREDEQDPRADVRSIAVRVYRDQGDHQAIVDLLPETPDSIEQQDQLMESLLALGQLDRAQRLFHRLDSELVPDAARDLADVFYEQEQWRPARTFYRELLDTEDNPRVRYRLGRIATRLDQPEEAWDHWTSALRQDPSQEWVTALIGGLSELVPQQERWSEGVDLLESVQVDEPELSNQMAQLGLWWALQADESAAVDRYLDRVEERAWAYHDRIGRLLHSAGDWSRLERWQRQSRQHATDWEERELAYQTYEGQLRLHRGETEGLEDWINERIDRANRENSDMLPRYHRLLGEWAAETGDYERAAIEFYQVANQFDDSFERDLARLGLARSYVNLDQVDRARTQLERVLENAQNTHLEARARELLDEIES